MICTYIEPHAPLSTPIPTEVNKFVLAYHCVLCSVHTYTVTECPVQRRLTRHPRDCPMIRFLLKVLLFRFVVIKKETMVSRNVIVHFG